MSTIITFPFPEANADARTNIIERHCQKLPPENSSNYLHNYHALLNLMRGEMYKKKFASKEFGIPPSRTYMLSQCMEDLTLTECNTCFAQMNHLLADCLPAISAHVFLDGCFLRLENYSFYGEPFAPFDDMKCGVDAEQEQQDLFRRVVEEVVNKVSKNAPNENGFATHKYTLADVSAYAMASCLKTLNHQMCSQCLTKAASTALTCIPAIEGRVLFAGCFLRYSRYEFANDFKPHKDDQGMEMDLSLLHKSLKFLQFKYSTIEKATDCFDESNKLGHGGYGEIFKGTLQDGREIAVKRLFISRKNRIKEICNEMDIMSRAHHKNLVQFLGCCFTKKDSFVVYEFVQNKSLDRILFDPKQKKELDWKKRHAIIIGTAEGLEYLHKDGQMQIVHRDIKASNILLDLKHRPKIADFGLARFSSSEKSLLPNTAIAGTLGYMAPEYIANGQLTEKVDIYSFGVLVLEIVSGVQNNKFQSDDGFETLVTHTWKHFQAKTVLEIIDKSIEIEDVEEVKRVVWVGLLCTQELPTLRPSMTNVVQMLKQKDITLPTPSKPPFTDECMELSHTSGFSRRQSSAKILRV
ncbi:hypothetical protein CICLE_v10018177mg [Citrus x clementina]|uniref:Protein kinase domain-containing protein n=1 Tax=Citrus clementina TaxID=85681 RepID=V4THB9_CITCL|nr:hypothetical protein CICLE_v10018177mg [Citrus x clementina]